MRVNVAPRQAAVEPGQPVVLSVTVTNTGDVISGHQIRVLGLDPRWVSVDREQFSLFPGATGAALITIALPPGTTAGQRQIAVQVRELTPPRSTSVTTVDLLIPQAKAVAVRLDPMTVTGGRKATFALVVENIGNTMVTGHLGGADPEEKAKFHFTPADVALGPGEQMAAQLRLQAPRRFAGSPAVRPFHVGIRPDGEERIASNPDNPKDRGASGTFIQRPWMSRGAFSLVGLLAAVTVFALVITYALSGVVNKSAADRNLALQVAQAQQAGQKLGASTVSGTVRLLTSGTGVPGVTVEVFSASDSGSAVTSTATDKAGAYQLGGLAAGSYKLRFRGAGFAELWYPNALTDSDAATIDLEAGQSKGGLDVMLGGLPASLSGTVVGDEPVGATVTLEIAGDNTADDNTAGGASGGETGGDTVGLDNAGAILRTVTVAADGSFTLDQVPSPSVYDLVVSKPGYATVTERIDLGGGEHRKGVQVLLRKGDGLIAGTVSGVDGPVGGATITASSGQTTVQTVSLTEDPVGSFTLRGLPTPATFTVVVAKPGFASQTLTLSLTAAQQLAGVGITLGNDSGSLSGMVTTLADGQPAGDVTVTVTNGAFTVQTVTQSTGTPGAWSVTGLAVPSTYTVTFSRADLASQTVSVSLDGFGAVSGGSGVLEADQINASLKSASAVLKGQAFDDNGTPGNTADDVPLGEVQVTLTSSAGAYSVTTASVPTSRLGQYEIDRLPPGTYTVSVNRKGARPTSTIVTLTAGEVHEYNPTLEQPASISGVVYGADGVTPLAGAQVVLYLASQYPTTILRTATTDASGHYSFIDVDAPESYVVEFSYPAGGSPQASATVSVAESEDLVVNLQEPSP